VISWWVERNETASGSSCSPRMKEKPFIMEINARAFGIAVVTLGVAFILCIAGIIGLAAFEKPVPDILPQLSTLIAGGLIGMLVKTPTQPPVGGQG
jgi:hypothetical protein